MSPVEFAVVAVAILVVAAVYSCVGHGGASGYLMVMGLAGMAPEVMKPTALLLNLFVASMAAVRFSRAGGFDWRTLLPFAAASLPCAFVGGAIQLDPVLYKRLVGLVLLFAAWRLWSKMPSRHEAEPQRPVPILAGVSWGAAIGLLSGIVGVGGGIFLSPVLLLAGWATARRTAGISAAFILINSAAALVGFAVGQRSVVVEPGPTAIFIAVVLVGGLIGTSIGVQRLGHLGLRRTLAAVVLFAGIKMVVIAPGHQGPDPVTEPRESAKLP